MRFQKLKLKRSGSPSFRLKGVRLDGNKAAYSTAVVKSYMWHYIPHEDVKTKELDEDQAKELSDLLEHNWAVREIVKKENVKLVQRILSDGTHIPEEDYYDIEKSEGIMMCHIPGPHGEGYRLNDYWRRIERIVLT